MRIGGAVSGYLMALVMMFPMKRKGRDCSHINRFPINIWSVSGADSSAVYV